MHHINKNGVVNLNSGHKSIKCWVYLYLKIYVYVFF